MEARLLLRAVQFPGDDDNTYLIALASPAERKALVSKGGEDSRIAAAVEIQRVWRGHRTRSKIRQILSSAKESSSNIRQAYDRYVSHCKKGECANVMSFTDYCAQRIQKWWKSKAKAQVSSATVEDRAASVVQRSWRRYSDRKVFQFYRQIINFHNKGNPESMLKSINPKEAKLMDRASGSLVRFRLGGIKFPPNIYYKIFTQQPVVDMCAFSPRDYTAMSEKLKLPQDVHNKGDRSLGTNSEGWYQRIENNGWRLVSQRMENGLQQDPLTISTSQKVTAFHHMKVQRREDTKRMRKQRRIEWMTKLYSGKLVPEDQPHKPDEEEEVDDLLQWTNTLDYEQYMTEWQSLATSNVSNDPYSLHIKQ